ncbi:MAG: replicative DNA helicase [Fidelibacterota bacterium]
MINIHEHSELELAIIGAVLNDPDYSRKHITVLQPEHFYTESHRAIFRAIQSLYDSGITPDIISVNNYLHEVGLNNHLDPLIASVEDVLPRQSNIPTSGFIKQHIRLLIQKYIERQNRELGKRLSSGGDYATIRAEYDKRIADAQKLLTSDDMQTISESCHTQILQELIEGQKPNFLKTGFPDLDHRIIGFGETDYWILAARTGLGKTTMGLNISFDIAKRGIPTLFISLELPETMIYKKIISAEAKIDFSKILSGQLTDSEKSVIADTIDKIHQNPFYCIDNAGSDIDNILLRCSEYIQKKSVRLIVLDYIQLLAEGDNKHSVLSDISRKIKLFALSNRVPFLVIAQLSRAIESRVDKRPVLSDLKESGSLEQDADGVLFISRLRESEAETQDNGDTSKTRLYIGKNRHGGEGMIELRFRGEYQRFECPSRYWNGVLND